MESQTFSRRVYPGAPVDGIYTISAIRYKSFNEDEKFRTCRVNNLSEYESGCHEHSRCFGHMCETPNGLILPPQSMSMRTMEISTEYNTASQFAFKNQREEYIEVLRRTNYTKEGTMRCIMSTPVLGSGRLIASPNWENGKDTVALHPNLASKMKVCRRSYDENGNMLSIFEESSLREGDMVILVRPPSLGIYNTQPLRVVFWNNQCIGIHPETFSAYHGDFDGDEAHIYPIYETDSIKESSGWYVMPLPAFEEGRKLFANIYPMLYDNRVSHNDLKNIMDIRGHLYKQRKYDESRARFIDFTTLSAAQMMQDTYKLTFGNYSRNKDHHIKGMHDRFNTRETENSFVKESIRGTEDVTKQQLSQGDIGHMSRIAKIVASCFFRHHNGGLYVVTRYGTKLLVNDGRKDTGTPSVRAVSLICAVSQQAALDSHRAESHGPVTHDLISDLIIGCTDKPTRSTTSHLTLVEFNKEKSCDTYAEICKPYWIYEEENSIYALCKPHDVTYKIINHVVGTYNPKILSLAKNNRMNIHEICKRGIKTICNYYKIRISDIELSDIASVISYEPHNCTSNKREGEVLSITSRDGMVLRNLGWIETLQATDYRQLPSLESDFEEPNTSSAAMFMSNFSNLKLKND